MDQALEQQLDRNYRFQRHIYDLSREYYLLGRDRLILELDPPRQGSVLEIGCGTARNLIKAARDYPDTDCYGVDLSSAMLEVAGKKITQADLRARISLQHGDATNFDASALFGRRTFDRIFFSYSLSMIPPWQMALRHASSLLSPQGSLHIVDFGRGTGLPSVFNAALRSWLTQFHVTPRDGLKAELDLIAMSSTLRPTVMPLFRDYTVLAVLSRV